MCLVDRDQLKGKILTMPGGDGMPYYLVEIIEIADLDNEKFVGCQVIVPKDKVFKYIYKPQGKIQQQEVIFDRYQVVAQYKDRDDGRVFSLDDQYESRGKNVETLDELEAALNNEPRRG